MDGFIICWTLTTVFCCGAWVGWFSGRRHEKSVQVTRRMRVRRPITVNVDYDFGAAAFKAAGFKIVREQERLH